jgi:hypothetical protein
MDEYYVMQGEQQAGPYTLAQLQGMWRNGQLTAHTLYTQPGFDEWFRLSTIAESLEPPRRTIRVAPAPSKPSDRHPTLRRIMVAFCALGFLGSLAIGNLYAAGCFGFTAIFLSVSKT